MALSLLGLLRSGQCAIDRWERGGCRHEGERAQQEPLGVRALEAIAPPTPRHVLRSSRAPSQGLALGRGLQQCVVVRLSAQP
jgi:hypothetical protein